MSHDQRRTAQERANGDSNMRRCRNGTRSGMSQPVRFDQQLHRVEAVNVPASHTACDCRGTTLRSPLASANRSARVGTGPNNAAGNIGVDASMSSSVTPRTPLAPSESEHLHFAECDTARRTEHTEGLTVARRYLRMLTARATTSTATMSEMAASVIIRSLAHGRTADTSVGLKAIAVLNERWR